MDQPDLSLSRRDFLMRFAGSMLSAAACAGGGVMLVRGNEGRPVPCLRPPGALPEDEFLATCIRCGRCIDACPNRCIVGFTSKTGKDLAMKPGRGQPGTPVIFPRRQACFLCNGSPGSELLCTASCPSGALRLTRKNAGSIHRNVNMGTAEIDKNLCYSFNNASCGACVRACPFEGSALKAGLWEKPIIDVNHCVGCGLCERACIRYPQAIRVRPRSAGSSQRKIISGS